jgi:hypothetical protein
VREGKNLKGWVLGFVLGTIGRQILEKAFVNSVKAIEARNAFCKAASCLMCGKKVVRSSQNWRGSGAQVVAFRRCSHAEIAEQLPNNTLQNEGFGANQVLVTQLSRTQILRSHGDLTCR